MSLLAQQGRMLKGFAGDPFFANVVSLLNFIGTDGQTNTTDTTGRSWTFEGNAQIDTAVAANGISSLLLDGDGDYIRTPHDSALGVGVATYTMEVVFRQAVSKLHVMVSRRPPSGGFEFYWYLNGNKLRFLGYGPTVDVVSLISDVEVPADVFVHSAVVRDGSNWYLFQDGVLVASTTQTGVPVTDNQPLFIGRQAGFAPARDFNGWIGGWRRTNNVARWTSNFSPPAMPFPTE